MVFCCLLPRRTWCKCVELPRIQTWWGRCSHMGEISTQKRGWNTPQIILFVHRVFHYTPSILGENSLFLETSICFPTRQQWKVKMNMIWQSWSPLGEEAHQYLVWSLCRLRFQCISRTSPNNFGLRIEPIVHIQVLCCLSLFRTIKGSSLHHMGVSKNRGTPKSSHFNRVFHYKPSILGENSQFLETSIFS